MPTRVPTQWMRGVGAVSLGLCLWGIEGCAGVGDRQATHQQEDLGRGIVWGTLATHEQGRSAAQTGDSRVLVGQVIGLEGAAYLLRDASGRELRVPHDENTRSDRPAHVGDRIQAALDRQGRAVRINNLDVPSPSF